MKHPFLTTVLLIGVLALAIAGCAPSVPASTPAAELPTVPTSTAIPAQGQVQETGQATLQEIDLGSLSGTIYSAGSSTVYPLSETIAENFIADGFSGEMKIDSIGSGAGFERFCKTGETDISNASRKIKDSEVANCKAIGRTPIEFRVGTDAIAVVVSAKNDFLTALSMDDLAKVFSDQAVKWSDINPAWPSEDIQRFTPGTDSGTFDFFVETVIQKPQKIEKLEDAKKIALAARNLQTSEDDNVLVQGIEGSKFAIGYFGFAYYQNEAMNLKALSINDVAPSFESAENGKYALARPLFLYSDAHILKEKPQVAAFIHYYLANVNDVIGEVGYFPASGEALDTAKQAWLDAMKSN